MQDASILWEAPLAHIIKRTHAFATYRDASFDGSGGFSLGALFWWHLVWPMEVVHLTRRFIRDKNSKKLISINVLEFVAIIINYATALTYVIENPDSSDPHPVSLNWADSKSALRWVTHACKGSLAGRALSRLFCSLLINSKLGIDAKWKFFLVFYTGSYLNLF